MSTTVQLEDDWEGIKDGPIDVSSWRGVETIATTVQLGVDDSPTNVSSWRMIGTISERSNLNLGRC